MTHPLLAISNLSIAFRQQGETQTVVHNLSLEVAAGETLALVSESGSGKNISALSVPRLLPIPPASYPNGDIHFYGQSLLHADESILRGVRDNRIATIFREPMVSLNPLHTLEKQLYEVLSLHWGAHKEAARGETFGCLERVGIRQTPQRLADYPHQLSGGGRQRAVIAMALLTHPELLITDEPTTALDMSAQVQILQLLRELKRELGIGLLFITHNLSIVRQLANRIAVMQNGHCMEQNDCRALFSAPAHPYTRRLLDSEPDSEPVPLTIDIPALLQADDLSVVFPVRRGVLRRVVDHHRMVNSLSFQPHTGKTLGLVGESGSGESTTSLALLRLISSEGKITFTGQPIQRRNRRQLLPLRRQVQVVFQDPSSSLNSRLTAQQVIKEGLRVHQPTLTAAEREQAMIPVMQEVGLNPASRQHYPVALSGNQWQRIAIARTLIVKPQLIILDEPTSSLDKAVQVQILSLSKALQQKRQLAYIFISHNLRVVRVLRRQVMVLRQGGVVEQGRCRSVFGASRHEYTRQLLALS